VAGTCAGHEVRRGGELACLRVLAGERESWVARRVGKKVVIIGGRVEQSIASTRFRSNGIP